MAGFLDSLQEAAPAGATATKPRNLKVNNRKTVLDMLRKYGEMSATELSERSDLSRTTVMKTLNHFLSTGFVLSEGKGESTNEGGKKPEIFAFNAKKGYICTLAVFADHTSCGITDLGAQLLTGMKMPHSPNEKLQIISENLAVLIMAAVDNAGIALEDLYGIAVCLDGIVDSSRGIVNNATHFPSWGKDVPLRELVRCGIGKNIEVLVESCVRMLGYAELRDMPALAGKNVVTFFGDIGVGSCILKQGRIEHGNRSFMGELGHMILNPGKTELCYCGSKGCLEMLISEPRVLIKARREYSAWPESRLFSKAESGELNLQHIFESADNGDSFARYLVDYIVRYFAQAIHNTILSHDPDVIILQGCFASGGTYFLNSLREQVRKMQFAGFGETAKLRYSSINLAKVYLTGPAYYITEAFFNNEDMYDAL